MSYLAGAGSTRKTPQSQPIPGRQQVENSAGGYVFALGPLERLRRFLILGTEGGTYYAGQRAHTQQALAGVRTALDELGVEAVDEIVRISQEGRAPRNDEAVYALAMAAGHTNPLVRDRALRSLSYVCRIGTHLFQFMEAVEHFRGHGVALNTGLRHWYLDKNPDDLAYQLVKYRQRAGWTHADVLRKVKPKDKGLTPEMDRLLGWAARGQYAEDLPRSVQGYEAAQSVLSPTGTVAVITEYGSAVPWEALKTEHLTDPAVIEALVPHMPLGALVRQLGRMSAAGALKPMGELTRLVAARLIDAEEVEKSKLHPVKVLSALATYQSGAGVRGSLTWSPAHEIVDALDAAFYLAFKNVEPTGQRQLLALDVSGSMDMGVIAGVPGLTPRVAAAAMAMVTARSGDPYHVTAFADARSIGHYSGWHSPFPSRFASYYNIEDGIADLALSPRERLDDVVRKVNGLPMGGTDCALPMLYAIDRDIDVDVFVIYTDNETWAGNMHPVQALQQYREQRGINAKLVVVGMTATEFSIADPADGGTLDLVGMDTATPQLIADFAAGRV